MHDDFGDNLRLLCSYYKSTAEVCRRLGINRPQFNRYLNGINRPSDSTMRRLCDFFGVEVHEMLLPHGQFQRLIQVRPQQGERTALLPLQPDSLEQQYLQRLNRAGQNGLDKYLGYYFEYYLSMAYPGSILRTLVCLEEHDGKTYYQRTERIRERPGSKPFHGVYRGMVEFLSDRIFLSDYETLTNFEMTQTVLYPSFRNRVDRLSGLRIGVSGSGERVPCCTRVLYEYLWREVDRQRVLALCGLYSCDDPALDADIRAAIRNDIGPGEWHFRARF